MKSLKLYTFLKDMICNDTNIILYIFSLSTSNFEFTINASEEIEL